MIFGMLDELVLSWVLGRAPKKFDIVRAADWIISLVTIGLEQRKEPA